MPLNKHRPQAAFFPKTRQRGPQKAAFPGSNKGRWMLLRWSLSLCFHGNLSSRTKRRLRITHITLAGGARGRAQASGYRGETEAERGAAPCSESPHPEPRVAPSVARITPLGRSSRDPRR